jgi:hypothetical protein
MTHRRSVLGIRDMKAHVFILVAQIHEVLHVPVFIKH